MQAQSEETGHRSERSGRKGFLVVAGLAVCGTVGCHEHVALNAPEASAPVEERRQAYAKLHPLTMHETHTTYLQGGAPVGAIREVDYLQLASGQRVYYPEDLLAVVDKDSPAGQAAERSHSARSTTYTLRGVGVGGIVVGAGIMILPLMQDREPGESINMTPMWIGGGIMLAGGLMQMIAGAYSKTANDEASTSFELYDEALRQRLDLSDGAK